MCFRIYIFFLGKFGLRKSKLFKLKFGTEFGGAAHFFCLYQKYHFGANLFQNNKIVCLR